ncbi:hypothetical protein [Actinomadura kijaniata]|uniref:hypothetical protein n=1 Tax=Actinomadura kijaniata TaxID=46161 RepID=UPI00082CB868|nr:hypothetical protein [Actinomadura kijaniata]
MSVKKLVPALAAAAALGVLGAPAASAAAAPAAPAAAPEVSAKAKVQKWHISVSPFVKEESRGFKTTRKGVVYVQVTKKQFKHRVDLRLIKCGSHVGLTDWQHVKKDGKYHAMRDNGRNKVIAKGTCLMIQAKQSPGGHTYGNIKDVKKG